MNVSTTSCGHAPPTDGSGVAFAANMVLTAAHVVAGATDVTVSMAQGEAGDPQPGVVVGYDTLRDLALIELDSDALSTAAAEAGAGTVDEAIVFGTLTEGETGRIVGAATSGDVMATVVDRTIIEMDEVRGSRRSQRSGYLLSAATQPGDSGSGLYDDQGRLAGLLFAVSTDDQARSWATAANEIEEFIADPSLRGSFACDPDRSRLIRAD